MRDSGLGGIAGDVVDVVDVSGVAADVVDAPACSQGFGGDAMVIVILSSRLDTACSERQIRQARVTDGRGWMVTVRGVRRMATKIAGTGQTVV